MYSICQNRLRMQDEELTETRKQLEAERSARAKADAMVASLKFAIENMNK